MKRRAAEQEAAKLNQLRNKKITSAVITAGVIGLGTWAWIAGHSEPVKTSPMPSAPATSAPTSAEPAKKKASWRDHYYDQGIPIDVIAAHSPTYMNLVKRSKQGSIEAGDELRTFHESRDFRDYNIRAMGAKYSLLTNAMVGINEIYTNVFLKQNGFEDTAIYAEENIHGVDDRQAQDMLLNIAFYLDRSTRASVGLEIDTLGDSWKQGVIDGDADCKVHAAFQLFNFYSFARRFNRMSIVPNVRVVGGMTQLSGRPHAWLEAQVEGEWKIIECNSPENNNLLGSKFDPDHEYWMSGVQNAEVSKGYMKLCGFAHNPDSNKYVGVVFTLPKVLDEEMRANGWKPE